MRTLPGDPPPYLYRGPSILARFIFFTLLALLLLFIDTRYQHLEKLRGAIAAGLQPLQEVAHWPQSAYRNTAAYFADQRLLLDENLQLTQASIQQAQQTQEALATQEENRQLKALLALKGQLPRAAQAVEALHGVRDPFIQKLSIDKGSGQGVQKGAAVFDGRGVIGQVTQVFTDSAEVTLLIEKSHMTPVQIERTGLRTVLSGMGLGQAMELRFVAPSADVKLGDRLVTSGLDNIYPPGLAVAEVTAIDRDTEQAFAHITARPVAGVSSSRYLLVVDPVAPPPPVPLPPPPGTTARERR